MTVHTERASHREVRVGLHDLHGEIVRINDILNLTPCDSRLHRDGFVARIQCNDPVEMPHVQMEAVFFRDLPTLTMTGSADGNRPVRGFHSIDNFSQRCRG